MDGLHPTGEAVASDAVAGVRPDLLGALLMESLQYYLLFRRSVGPASTMRPGTIRGSRRTETGRWRRRSPPVPEARCGPPQGEKGCVHGSLLGRRYADRGVGVDEERPARRARPRATTRRSGSASRRRRGGETWSELPRREVVERYDKSDHRSRRGAHRKGDGKEAMLAHGPRPDGEPPRPAGRCLPTQVSGMPSGRRRCAHRTPRGPAAVTPAPTRPTQA